MENADDPWDDEDEIDITEFEAILDQSEKDNSNQRLNNESEIGKSRNDCSLLRSEDEYVGFDDSVGKTWIYPSNLPCRAYQLSISQAALYSNTLVVLPTGLGKTFIAAVVMYNIYRWYPNGKVIFMAPTRPLVAQQIGACQHIMPFPPSDTVDITGKVRREKRMEYWRTKRVFFATPQVVQADMCQQSELEEPFPFKSIKLIVIDEAHKARGRYAYTDVAQTLWRRNRYFRVLALSATPGRTMDDVAEVVRNLFISHVEVRSDECIDVTTYVHKRSMKTVVVPLGEKIKHIREELVKIIDPYLRQLIDAGVVSGSHQRVTRNFLLFEQKRFREQSAHERHPEQSAVNSNFSICISLFHSLELLESHGLRVFVNSFDDDDAGRPKFVLTMNPALRNLINRLRGELGPNPFEVSAHPMTNGCLPELPADLDFGHPKFQRARECLLEHFEKNSESRAIVFCEYRESVILIHRLLLQHTPLLRPRCFVGQGGTSGPLRALSQKQQVQIMTDFRSGKSNVLIATSVGEEGIDVGEVDLIVCFDISTTNPTRFIQRIGRTGRQRKGYVVILVTEGKEQQILKEVLANKDQINKKIVKSSAIKYAFYKESPRLVPPEYNPQCVKTFIRPIEIEEPPEKSGGNREKKKKSSSKAPLRTKQTTHIKSTQDLRRFFKKATEDNAAHSDDLDDEFQLPSSSSKAAAAVLSQATTDSCHERVKNLFKGLNMCMLSRSNSQLLQTQTAAAPMEINEDPEFPSSSSSSSKLPRLSMKEIKRVNKLLKTTNDLVPLSVRQGNLVEKLKLKNLSRSGKLLYIKLSFSQIRELFEKMDILQALEADDENMSSEEKQVRETCEGIQALFADREALERFLEDAECESKIQSQKLNEDEGDGDGGDEEDEFAMSNDNFNCALDKIFNGLDMQGNNWDNFDYRQEEFQKTNFYKEFKSKRNEPESSNGFINSMVFDGKSTQSITEFDEITITDSRYSSQWNRDFNEQNVSNVPSPDNTTEFDEFTCRNLSDSVGVKTSTQKRRQNAETRMQNIDFNEQNEASADNMAECDEFTCRNLSDQSMTKTSAQKKRKYAQTKMQNHSTPLSGPLAKAFERQKNKEKARKISETNSDNQTCINDSKIIAIDSDDDDDVLSAVLVVDDPVRMPEKRSDGKDIIRISKQLPSKQSHHQTPISSKSVETSFMLRQQSTPKPIKSSDVKKPAIEDEILDVNFDDFEEAFTDEFDILTEKLDSSWNSIKEIAKPSALNAPAPTSAAAAVSPEKRDTADLFRLLEAKPTNSVMTPKMTSTSTSTMLKQSAQSTPPAQKSSSNLDSSSIILDSPKCRLSTLPMNKQHEKSPSILRSFVQGKQRLERLRQLRSIKIPSSIANENDSPVLAKAKTNNFKRKIIDSETESDAAATPAPAAAAPAPATASLNCESNSDSDFEQITATQMPKRPCLNLLQERKSRLRRRAKFCPFFDEEAEKEKGSGHTTEEGDSENDENTLENFVCDSVIVDDNNASENDDDRPSGTQMQAFYMQSVKSPCQRNGRFKIPEKCKLPLNDDIYSQEVTYEPTQYDDSFVVAGNEGDFTVQTSLCPLERAEKILKERKRKAKRQRFAEIGVVNQVKKRSRKCYQLQDDSDTSDGVV